MSKEFRELQVSTTALIFIILGVLILGTVIFFLGVQVGKKQADLMGKTLLSQKTEENISSPTPVVPAEETPTGQQPASASEKTTESTSLPVASNEPGKASTEIKKTETQTQAPSASTSTSSPPAVDNRKTESVATTSTATKPKTTTPAAAPKASSGNFFIQVGAFNDRPSAQLAAERFKKMGHKAVVKDPFPKDRKPIYRVWVGGFKTREEAQKTLNQINASSGRRTGYFIVQQ